MALIEPFRDEGAPDELLAVAEKHFKGALLALNQLTVNMENGAEVASTDLQRATRDFRASMQTLFDERTRVEKQRKTDAGVVYDYGLDFDVARDQIRSLLDRLREN